MKDDRGKKDEIRLDEIINDIYDCEAVDLPGFLEKSKQDRIEDRIMSELIGLPEKGEMKNKRKRPKRWFVFGLAAVLLLGFGLLTFASSNPDIDIEILRFMGLDEEDTVQLESGEVEIFVHDSCLAKEYGGESNSTGIPSYQEKEVKIMAVSSIGDKNSACIRIETDYELPKDFQDGTEYIMPEDFRIEVYEKRGRKEWSEMAATMGYFNDHGKLGYMIYITDCNNLNKSKVIVSFQDFYLYHEGKEGEESRAKELLLEGKWELNWKYAYKSNTQIHRMLKPIEIDEITYYITKAEISPLSVSIYGFRMPRDRKEEFDGFTIDRIQYKDGTCLEVGAYSGAGNRNGIWMEGFLGTTEMRTTIDVKNVKSIVVGGNEIRLK